MQGTLERHGRWFCSERCAAEYERSHHLQDSPSANGPRGGRLARSECPQVVGRVTNPWLWVPLTAIALSTAEWWWPGLAKASAIYRGYLSTILGPLLLGLLIGGMIDHWVPREYIAKLLAGSRKRVIARATLLGFLASSCSHGCLALTIELYRKGASIPAVISFLLASPWASMSLTLILLSLFGLKGVAITTGALIVAFVTGVLFQRLSLRGLIDTNPHTVALHQEFSIWEDASRRIREYPWTLRQFALDARGIWAGMIPLGRMVLGWVQLGLVLSSVIGALVPHAWFTRFLGPSLGGLLLSLVFAAVMEVCSEGTAPVAFELYRHTGALGNAFAFLMGGVVTDYTELAAVWANIGRRTVAWMLLVTLPLVAVLGFLMNLWR